MNNKKIIYLKVKNSQTELIDGFLESEAEVIATFAISEIEEAYAMATLLDQNGVEVELFIPGAAESLANELGLSLEDREKLKCSMEQEIREHD
jgi:hypothetical protein